ncbi:MAG: hypothetical protein JF586_16625 [Burkholderiales bacterium]|jgi:hypothetical protein|nr:hypothetical protein [Burkholderiales bacterium]
MSTNFFSWTFPIDPASPVPAPAEIDALVQKVSGECLGVDVMSRGDWFAGTLVRMARRAESTALDFFEATPAEVRVVGSHGYAWGVTILQAGAVASALTLIDALRARCSDDPAWCIPFFTGGRWDEAEIRQLIGQPDFDGGDEGVGPGYFIAHLRFLGAVLKEASADGMAIAHVRFLNE